MRTYHAHRFSVRDRQAKKRRRLLIDFVSVILLLLCGYGFSSFGKDTSTPQAETVPLQTPPAKNIHPAWPTTGQAAIGSIENGLLARSSDNEEPHPTASMAKVIVALAIMEKQPFKLGQTGKSYTLTAEDVINYHAEIARGGSLLPVYAGMKLTQYQAMQAMLIASANNMADTLVRRVFGSEEAYISYAQNMLRRMGLSKTIVADASGYSPATVSTPSELVAIGIVALKNPVIAEIVAQSQAQIPDVGIIKNTNELLGSNGVIGLKTGTTDEAGHCLLFAARHADKDGKKVTVVGVIMGAANTVDLFGDSSRLLASAKQGLDLTEAQSTSSSKQRFRNP